MMRYRLLGLLLLALSLPAPAAERVALVIGNSAYAHTSRLHNPGNDAREVAAALERLGFAVTRVDEADYDGLRRTLSAFREVSRGAELALLYYAGHAIQVDGRNYLVPVDARVRDPSDVELQLVALHIALQQLQAPLNVVILDACRDNPFAETLRRAARTLNRNIHLGRGLERVDPGLVGGAYLMMAAAPGAVAQDGPAGGHSPYTAALLEHLETPELDLRFLHARVRAAVERRTGGRQSPEAIDRLPPEPIYLAGGSLRIDEPAAPARRGRLTITSQPPGAAIYLDGALLGEATQRYPAPREGTQQVELEARLDGYRTRTERVWLRAGQDSSVRLLLQAEAPAVEPEPRWISGARVNVRSGPGTGHGVVTQLVQGQEVQWLGSSERDPSWQRIRLDDGREAYAHGDLLGDAPLAAVATTGDTHRDQLRDDSEGPAMVFIEGGTFTMGSPEDEVGRNAVGDGEWERQHRVSVNDFYLAKHTVTVGEFRRFVESSGYRTEAERNVREPGCYAWSETQEGGEWWAWRAKRSWRDPGFDQSDRHPAVCVSWNDALAYIEWLNQQTGRQYRLPTEAEWEYAARAGTSTARFWGNDPNQACRYANVGDRTRSPNHNVSWIEPHECSDGYFFTAPVGSFEPNAWGLYDVLGNVWEWTCSEFDADYGGAETRCTSRSNALRVIRGGAWANSSVRSAGRDRNNPSVRSNLLGFRLARLPEALELAYWRSIRDSEDAADYRDYLERFPEGTFRTLAERRLAALRTPEPRPPSVEPEPRWISGTRVNVRSGPGTDHGVVTQLVQGQEVQWLGSSERDPSWQRIRLDDGREAYVHGTLLSREQIAAAPPPPTPPTERPPSGEPDMVPIRGGTFTMGSPEDEVGRNPIGGDRERRHRVTVEDFHIGRYAVTFDEYDRFARATDRGLPDDRGWGRGRRPVIHVDWHDATAYAEWLSERTGRRYRLPTEAEWEYACRAGGRHRYCGGDDVDAVAWYSDNSGGRTRPVGEKQANAWGLYDMSGNAWEWTCSAYDADYGGAETRCISDKRSNAPRVIRGGAWYGYPSGVRSAYRTWFLPDSRIYFQGFRLARSP